MKNKCVQKSLSVDEKTWQLIKKEAEKQDLSASRFLKKLFENFMKAREK